MRDFDSPFTAPPLGSAMQETALGAGLPIAPPQAMPDSQGGLPLIAAIRPAGLVLFVRAQPPSHRIAFGAAAAALALHAVLIGAFELVPPSDARVQGSVQIPIEILIEVAPEQRNASDVPSEQPSALKQILTPEQEARSLPPQEAAKAGTAADLKQAAGEQASSAPERETQAAELSPAVPTPEAFPALAPRPDRAVAAEQIPAEPELTKSARAREPLQAPASPKTPAQTIKSAAERAAEQKLLDTAAAQREAARRKLQAEIAARAAAETQRRRERQTAMATPNAPTTSRPATSSASTEDLTAYSQSVMGKIAAVRRYPEDARARGTQGTVVVGFSIGAGGEITSTSVRRSSGDAELDADALSTVRRAGPFGPPPAGAPRAFNAPLRYHL